MRRRTAHGAFAAVAVALGGALLWSTLELGRVETANAALAAVPATISSEEAATLGLPADAARAELAVAVALAAAGEAEAAETRFAELVRRRAGTPLGQAARFNLGNGFLREALAAETDPRRAGPLVELAKQRYRDLLRGTPEDWDARYNLERALRFAPEGEEAGESALEPVKSVDVVVPDFEPRDRP